MTMAERTNALRAELEAAVLVEIEHTGPQGFSKDPIVRRFLDRGASKPTIYRWIDATLAALGAWHSEITPVRLSNRDASPGVGDAISHRRVNRIAPAISPPATMIACPVLIGSMMT
jgi:hypothetical protein